MTTHTVRTVQRVLPYNPFVDLEAYIDSGGGRGLTAARAVVPEVVIAEIEASGLRGRGGAGFRGSAGGRPGGEREPGGRR